MSENLKLALLAALRRILEPLARLMVDAGIGVGEFQELAKVAFVKAAKDRAASDRKPSISAIGVMTGLRRGEVRRLLKIDETEAPEPERNRHRAERVLSGWWNDIDYLDEHGQPRPLPPTGDVSFESLVRKYSGDPRIRALRTELLRAKAITRTPDGKLQALSRTVANARWDPQGVAIMGERVRDLLSTLVHNLRRPSRPRYTRTVMTDRLDPRYLPILVRDLTTSADTLADSMEDSLHHPSVTLPAQANQTPSRVGLSIFVFEEDVDGVPDDPEPPVSGVADPKARYNAQPKKRPKVVRRSRRRS
jgi:hypothetical protein